MPQIEKIDLVVAYVSCHDFKKNGNNIFFLLLLIVMQEEIRIFKKKIKMIIDFLWAKNGKIVQ